MCAIGAWELMRAAAGERGKPLTPLTVIAAGGGAGVRVRGNVH